MKCGPIHRFLTEDHARLGELLRQSTAGDAGIDIAAYEAFRAGLLRHISMEEKVLFADSRRRRNGVPLPITRQLHADHAAMAMLLVPTPTRVLIASIRSILEQHDPLEEGPGGLYETCEQLAGTDIDELFAQLIAIPPVKVSAHLDDPRVLASVERVLAARIFPPGEG